MSDWEPHGFTKRVLAMELVVYQLADGCRWEVTGELFQAAGFCDSLCNAKTRAATAADAIDTLELLVSGCAPSGNRAPKPNALRGYVRKRCLWCDAPWPNCEHGAESLKDGPT